MAGKRFLGFFMATLLIGTFALALRIQPAKAGTSIVQNGGFETGDLTGWQTSYGGTFVTSNQHHSETYSAVLDVGPTSLVLQATNLYSDRFLVPSYPSFLRFWTKAIGYFPRGVWCYVYLLDYSEIVWYEDPNNPGEGYWDASSTLIWPSNSHQISSSIGGSWDWNKTQFDLSGREGHEVELMIIISPQGTFSPWADPYHAELYVDDVEVAPIARALVGGEWLPTNKLQLLTPWISLISLMTILTTSFVYVRRKRRSY